MKYDYQCTSCEVDMEIDIPMDQYDELCDKQLCPYCEGKLNRKIIWNGGVNLCAGMYGIDGTGGWNK